MITYTITKHYRMVIKESVRGDGMKHPPPISFIAPTYISPAVFVEQCFLITAFRGC